MTITLNIQLQHRYKAAEHWIRFEWKIETFRLWTGHLCEAPHLLGGELLHDWSRGNNGIHGPRGGALQAIQRES